MNTDKHRFAALYFAALCIAGGCCSYTLQKPADWEAVVRPQPVVVALGRTSDTVSCDDEAYYLQEYIEGRNLFYDTVLADLDRPNDYHDADVIISGTITPLVGRPKIMGLGVFATVLSGGAYGLLGGPFKRQETTVHYNFQVLYSDLNLTNTYEFSDSRKVSYGIYNPLIAIEQKPELYQAGWDALLYEICRELMAQQAGLEGEIRSMKSEIRNNTK